MKKYRAIMLFTILFSVLVALLVVLQFILPALSVGEKVSGTTFEYKGYSGFDVAFFCWPKFILGYQLIGPNPLLIAALLLPILATLICGLMWKNAGFKKRIILSVIIAATFIFFAVCFFQVKSLVMMSALAQFKEIVAAAMKKEMYKLGFFVIISGTAAIIGAALHVLAIIENIKMIKATGVEVHEDKE